MESELVILYSSATLFFPEWYKRKDHPTWKFEEDPGSIHGSNVRFTRNNYTVEAKIYPYNIPHIFSDIPEVQRDIVQPAVKIVTADIETVEVLFEDLRALMKQGIVQEILYYEKGIADDGFKVYDYSCSERMFEKLKALWDLGNRKSLVKEDLHDLISMGEPIGQEGDKVPYVEGDSLKEALERALAIYRLKDRIKEIPESICDDK